MSSFRFLRRRRYVMYRGELLDIARSVVGGTVASGSAVAGFERDLADYHGVEHVYTVNSGRVGLLVLLKSLGLRAGDEILVPAYTLRALIELLVDTGYVPVPVDVVPGGFNMDPDHARERIGPRTRAILATHMFGRPCAIEAFAELAKAHDLLLVEDCAQALGSEVGGVKVGAFGDGAILSFDLLKTVNTFGGGAIIARSERVAARVRDALSTFEPDPRAVVKRIAVGLCEHAALTGPTGPLVIGVLTHPLTRGLVARGYRSMQHAVRPSSAAFTNLQASIGARLLDSLDGRVSVRRAMAAQLAKLLGERATALAMRGENGYFFVRRVIGDAARLRRDLLLRGIDAGIGAEVADFCGDLGRAETCPHARAQVDSAIQLPLHEGLADPDLARIAKVCAGRLEPSPSRATAPAIVHAAR